MFSLLTHSILINFQNFRSNGDVSQNHMSFTNENVIFGKRDYGQMSFSYLNDLDRSEVETTTEL